MTLGCGLGFEGVSFSLFVAGPCRELGTPNKSPQGLLSRRGFEGFAARGLWDTAWPKLNFFKGLRDSDGHGRAEQLRLAWRDAMAEPVGAAA